MDDNEEEDNDDDDDDGEEEEEEINNTCLDVNDNDLFPRQPSNLTMKRNITQRELKRCMNELL